jgi:hypothetical protein
MLKIGLEKEFFLVNAQELTSPLCITPEMNLPSDESGLQVEARGKPHTDITEAVFSLKADIHRIEKKLPQGHIIVDVPIMTVSRSQRLLARTLYSKGTLKYANIYGHTDNRQKLSEITAGIHVSFTNQKTYINKDDDVITYNQMFDYIKIFTALDKHYKKEIRAAKRNPGFYELKYDGRIEYRSLPANIDLDELIVVLKKITK